MNKSLRRQMALVIATVSVLILTSCNKSCGRPTTRTGPILNSQDSSKPVFMEQPISFCWQRQIKPRTGKVQILVDGSGSMIGFQRVMPPLLDWIQHSVSQMQSSLTIESSRLCQFSRSYGIGNCVSINQSIAYNPVGNTNLHEAIRSARDYELTFILTDGVAATGSGGSGDCAGGVDASCVARALREAIHADASAGSNTERGLWLIPLVATYEGIFYTEEPITPQDFDTEQTIKQIRSDLSNQPEVAVQNPHNGNDGRLVFDYKGPRSMLLMVIARWSDLGRASIQALWDRAQYGGIERIDQLKNFRSGYACFKPIEVYPGFLNAVQWKSLQPPEDPSDAIGTMDAFFSKDSTKAVISLSCLKDTPGESVYSLIGSVATEGQVSGCVPIQLLPAFSFQFRPIREEDEQELAELLKGFERKSDSYADIRLDIACGALSSRKCDSNPISAQWMVYMSYGEAADALASDEQGLPLQQQIKELSTTRPSLEPHRIFGFAATIEAFYKEVAQDKRSIVLASLDFCHK